MALSVAQTSNEPPAVLDSLASADAGTTAAASASASGAIILALFKYLPPSHAPFGAENVTAPSRKRPQ